MINIPTRTTFYANEATEILNEISTYPGLLKKQIIQLHPGKESQTENILSFLQKQERIYRDKNKGFYKVGCVDRRNHDAIVRSIWVLLDFLTDVDYHAASEYPVMIVFFIRGEEYQIIYAAEGNEGIIGAILRQQSEYNARRIILIDNPWQIENLLYAGITAYCTVTYDGQIHYYKEKRK